jgi:hypothetical protein
MKRSIWNTLGRSSLHSSKGNIMPYIRTVPPEEATGDLKDIYEEQIKKLGYIPNYHKVFSLRPEVSLAWRNLQTTIRSRMRLRRFELVTFAAALALKCRY